MDFSVEQYYLGEGINILAGLDEVGRGPLAGPVVAAVVSVRNSFNYCSEKFKWVRDSKKLSAKRRAEVKKVLESSGMEIGIGICDQDTIDKINIRQASFLAMKKALGALKEKPQLSLIDGKDIIPNLSLKQRAIIRGDSTVFVIAAASIIAKEYRDAIMMEAHKRWPEYGFDKHKGYGTKLHMQALQEFGACPWHRKTFAPVERILACG
jgi:ribonuclease HII